jgi:hypothetical protein
MQSAVSKTNHNAVKPAETTEKPQHADRENISQLFVPNVVKMQKSHLNPKQTDRSIAAIALQKQGNNQHASDY